MTMLSSTLRHAFAMTFRDSEQKVKDLASHLTQEQFWQQSRYYSNSFGHLCLHLIGNLNHFIGAHVADTGYVRNRDLEFTDGTHPPKDDVLQRLSEAIAMVNATLENQEAEDWSKPYLATGSDYAGDRFTIFLRTATHFNLHVGQMINMVKEFSNDT